MTHSIALRVILSKVERMTHSITLRVILSKVERMTNQLQSSSAYLNFVFWALFDIWILSFALNIS